MHAKLTNCLLTLVILMGNSIFHQKWIVAAETKDKSTEVDIDDAEMYDNTDDSEPKKKRRKLSNLTYQLPADQQ